MWNVSGGPYREDGRRSHYECRCDCGLVKKVEAKCLARGESLGCRHCTWKQRDNYHGKSLSGNRLYGIWRSMRTRCNNERRHNYQRYGGRGIKLCPEWERFDEFYKWASAQYGHDDKSFQVDRADNDGPYSPENCRFVSVTTNCRNKRNNNLIEAFGETKCLADWCEDERCKATRAAIRKRIVRGWDAEKAIAAEIIK
jgi:hypothetical protein